MQATLTINNRTTTFNVEDLPYDARQALSEILGLDEVRAALFQHYSDLPRFRGLHRGLVKAQCPHKNPALVDDIKFEKVTKSLSNDFAPGFDVTVETHRAEVWCGLCQTTHRVEKQALRLYCKVDGVPFSRMFAI